MTTPRLGVLVVLYRPTGDQVDRLGPLAAQAFALVAVDNSPVPDPAVHARLASRGAAVLANANRGGIGGAFNVGLAHLRSRGAEAVLVLDQDSTVPAGFLEALARVCEGLGRPDYVLGARVFDVNAKRCVPAVTFTRFGLRSRDVADCPPGALLACSFVVSSGCVISLAAHDRIGPFREDFVIDHVDSDYCLRAGACGVAVLMSCTATLEHRIGRLTRHRLFGVELIASNHAASRRYYFARNAVTLTRVHGWRLPSVALVNLLTLGQMIAVLLFENDKLRKTAAALGGLADGLAGRAGPLEERRPRLAAWCRSEAAS